jgi:hypothetical protein
MFRDNSFTYRDMLTQSKKITKKLKSQFQKMHDDIQRDKTRQIHEVAQEIHCIEKQASKVLARPGDVKELSIQLTQQAKMTSEPVLVGAGPKSFEKSNLKKMHVNYAKKREKKMERIVFDPNRLLNRVKI